VIKRKKRVFFHMAPKGAPKFSSPNKLPKNSTIIEEEK
jgi:hypothetical protein